MAKDYFNDYEHKKILKLKETNPFLAVTMYEEYLKKYPNDYSAYCYYIDQLITTGKLYQAKLELEKLSNLVSNNILYLNIEKYRLSKLKENINYITIRLYMVLEKYYDALTYINTNDLGSKALSYQLAKIICLRKLGRLDQTKIKKKSYVIYQAVNYKEEAFLDHIKEHFGENEYSNEVFNYFSSDFDISKILPEVKKYIPSDNALLTGIGDSNYYFRYDGCGRYNKKVENYFKVVCFYKTNKIITMYPIDYGDNLPYVDLNYMKPKEEKIEDKRKDNDQISKFYKRYNIKKPSN